jgi:hypothetical protein
MQLRVLVSSIDSSRNFDLRCAVREGLIDFIRRHHPGSLPRARAEIDLASGAAERSLRAAEPGSAAT